MTTIRTTEMHPHHHFSSVSNCQEAAFTTSGSSSHHTTKRAESKECPAHVSDHEYGNVNRMDSNGPPSPALSYESATDKDFNPDCQYLTDQNIGEHISALMKSPSLSEQHKLLVLASLPPSVLEEAYKGHIASYGPPQVSSSIQQLSTLGDLSEDNYLPLVEHIVPSPNPAAPPPVYPSYVGRFTTSEQARRHRKRARLPPKAQAPDVTRVRRYGRKYWVRRIYEAMIDITYVSDSDSSIHRQRFVASATFEPADLEATAHHIFDSALAVHERGWSRPNVYYKKVVRGKLIDVSEKSLESRLARICYCLRQKKATVDDAVRGGITLALLCDNPEARAFTKASNNTGNKKRGEKLRKINRQAEEEQDDQDESE